MQDILYNIRGKKLTFELISSGIEDAKYKKYIPEVAGIG